jgi:lysophospholipase L1-like esterase
MSAIGWRNRARWVLFLAWAFVAASTFAQLAPVDPWQADIRAFEAADRAQAPEPGAVLFIGSSSIRFWESLQADFPGTRIIRRGFGGSEVRDATRFAGRIIIPYRPRLIVLYAGDNDLAAGRSPEQVRDDFIAFVERVRSDLPKTSIAFVTIKPSPARANLLGAMRKANSLISEAARSRRNIRIVDVFTPMLDADGQPEKALFGDDMLHMNRAGYQIWIRLLTPLLRQAALDRFAKLSPVLPSRRASASRFQRAAPEPCARPQARLKPRRALPSPALRCRRGGNARP